MPDTDPYVRARGPGGRRIRAWVRGHPGLVILLVAPVAVFGIPLCFGQIFLDGDNFIQNFPLRVLVGQDLIHGHLPLLDPYIYSGAPLLGGFNAGGAYPFTWLFAILPAGLAWTLNLIAAYEVAVAGTYLFLRRQPVSVTAATFGAAAFSFGGFLSGQIVHIDLISGAAWLPWLLLGVHGLTEPLWETPPAAGARDPAPRWWWAVVLAGATAMTILAGAAESVLDSAVVVLIYLVWRYWRYWRSWRSGPSWSGHPGRRRLAEPLGYLVLSLGVGLLASAAQWLPGLVVTAHSQRATATYEFFTSGSLPWRLTLLIFSPFLLGTNQNEVASYFGSYNFPEVTGYVGILALIAMFALLTRRWRRRAEAPRWWVWYAVLVISLLAALGGGTPFGHVLYAIPGIKSQRLLNRNLLGVDFALAALLAWWVQMVLTNRGSRPDGAAQGAARGDGATTEATGADPPGAGRASRRSRRVEVVVTCVPLAAVSVLCVGSWLWSSGLEQAIGTQLPSTSEMRTAVAAVLTGGVVIAAVATWLALFPGRLSRVWLRRALALIMIVDLVSFTALSLHGPVTHASAYVQGPPAAQLTAATGNGRFIIYDPDRFENGELYALGQTDVNLLTGVPSAQGYAALVDGDYYQATGAHLQEDLNTTTLSGTTWDELNVTALLSLPSYFVTPVPTTPPTQVATQFPVYPNLFGVPPVNSPVGLAPGSGHTWYFGGTLTVGSGEIPVQGASATAARIGLITPSGSVRWLGRPARASTGAAGSRGTSLHFRLPVPTLAAGIVVQNGRRGSVTALTPEVTTAEDGTVALNGRLQSEVSPPHWTFTGTIGSFGVFRNAHPRGWAWAAARVPGGASGRVQQLSAGIDGTQRFLVRAADPVWLVRSEAPIPGWHATLQRVDVVGNGAVSSPRGSPVAASVVSSTVTQRVAVPAGDFVVTFRYAPASALVGIALSVVGGSALVVGGVLVIIGLRRRRRAREGLRTG